MVELTDKDHNTLRTRHLDYNTKDSLYVTPGAQETGGAILYKEYLISTEYPKVLDVLTDAAQWADPLLPEIPMTPQQIFENGEYRIDFRDLEDGAANGDENCRLALDKFAYEVAKYVGAYAAALKGIDVLTFTAGVGENDGAVRAEVCEYLGSLGVKIDSELNKKRGKEMMISTPDSKVQVWVVPTNEELMIAQDTAELVKAAN